MLTDDEVAGLMAQYRQPEDFVRYVAQMHDDVATVRAGLLSAALVERDWSEDVMPSCAMQPGRYVGSARPWLAGKTCLFVPVVAGTSVTCQFDDRDLLEGYGWTLLPDEDVVAI